MSYPCCCGSVGSQDHLPLLPLELGGGPGGGVGHGDDVVQGGSDVPGDAINTFPWFSFLSRLSEEKETILPSLATRTVFPLASESHLSFLTSTERVRPRETNLTFVVGILFVFCPPLARVCVRARSRNGPCGLWTPAPPACLD